MRQYRDEAFTRRVAESAQDIIDAGALDAAPWNDRPSPASNLGRASTVVGQRSHETLIAVNMIEKAYFDLCSVALPAGLPTGYSKRLQRARWELLDVFEELHERWQDDFATIWNSLSTGGKVRRLQALAAEIEACPNSAQRKRLLDHLAQRVELDPDAAKIAQVTADGPGPA